jgi:hypothetical protein
MELIKRTTNLGLQAIAPNVSNISDSLVDPVINPVVNGKPFVYTRNDNKTPINLAAFDGKPVDIKLVKALIALKNTAIRDKIPSFVISSGYRAAWVVIGNDLGQGNDKVISKKGVNISATSQAALFALAQKKCKCTDPGTVFPPGQSQHGDGLAVDFPTGTNFPVSTYKSKLDPVFYKWMNANAYKFGFVRTLSFEEWHFEYRPGDYQYTYVDPFDKTYEIPENQRKNRKIVEYYRPPI